MRCPSCGYQESKVVDSRAADEGTSIRRRRECLECGARFTTYERLAENPILVIKTDGSSEVFSREKLMRGLLIACAKRSISPERIDSLIASIEAELRAAQRTEIKSKDLGDMVLARLAKLDDVAYIRFASVYKDFQSIEEFSRALTELS
ncbi:MAG: transcriptional repressor NrdR [Adlercreutzia sp.]|uniref:transcriptional regulator NrdR n=1 Tax=uncultured Adlercreutzia sp. TaxID=875803 RepID=UPI002171AC39|nr:transcriptional regulator NrdR [uncultured Adlercreutzia sp.]MCI8424854.1 transcriptional repressor NrdR [Adlercreutzia sp.]